MDAHEALRVLALRELVGALLAGHWRHGRRGETREAVDAVAERRVVAPVAVDRAHRHQRHDRVALGHLSARTHHYRLSQHYDLRALRAVLGIST